jgi:hypothetical protein
VWRRGWPAPMWPWRTSGVDSLGFTQTRSGNRSCGAPCGTRTSSGEGCAPRGTGGHAVVRVPAGHQHPHRVQTTARAFLTEAETHRELLVRHGLVESVLTELRQSLDQFDAAMVSGSEARAAHVRASAEIRRLADEVVQGVRVLDRFNRVRFRGTPEVLAAWRSVSNVVAPRGKTEPEGGAGSGGAPQDGGEVSAGGMRATTPDEDECHRCIDGRWRLCCRDR